MFLACVCGLVLGTTGAALAGERTDDPLGVAVSPLTLLLGEDQGGTVTVHTDIPYRSVDTSTVALNGIPAAWTRVDIQGELVGEFLEADIKAIVTPPEEVLTLTGNYTDGTAWSGSDTVRVIGDGETTCGGTLIPAMIITLSALGVTATRRRMR